MESVVSISTLHVSFICRSENVWADKPAQNKQQNALNNKNFPSIPQLLTTNY